MDDHLALNLALLLPALALALSLRPWRMLRGATRLTPLMAALTVMPWLWALPSLHQMPLQLQGSGACLLTLILGWPLAVPVLCAVGALAWWIAPLSGAQALDLTVWLGLVPATLALGVGAVLRRWIGPHLFVYVLGRAFLGTAASVFAAGVLAQASGHGLPGISDDLVTVAHWLAAWGDAFLTGMAVAIMVAYKPEWLATWSDRLYLRKP
ncbi:MAG: energy-coupling factor ABC transporter permease [Rhodoferax sp.]